MSNFKSTPVASSVPSESTANISSTDVQGAINEISTHIGNTSNPHNTSLAQISPLTAKGDILTRNALVHTKLTAGTDGQVLTADSASAEGIKWATPTTTGGGSGSLLITGLLSGGEMTINGGDATKVDIAAGEGLVVDNHTNPSSPVITVVTWAAQTAIVLPSIASARKTYLAIDSSGTVFQQTSPFSESQRRDLIIIGRAIHPDNTVVEYTVMSPILIYNTDLQQEDFIRAIGPININGNIYSPNGSNLKLNKSSGKTYRSGGDYSVDKKNPSTLAIPSQSALSWRYVSRDGSGGFQQSTLTSDIDSTKWDNDSGTLQNVPGGQFTVHRVFLEPGGRTSIHYGQALFSSMSAAEASLSASPFEVDPLLNEEAIFRAWIIVRGGTSNLTDTARVKFIPAGKFGASASSGASTATTDLQGAYDNSPNPEIVTDSLREALTIKEGSGVGGNLYEGRNSSDALVFSADVAGNITSGTVNGVVVEGHAARHQPNGSDPIPTANAVEITDATNGAGVSNSLSRADHVHAHGNRGGGTLHAAATTSLNGFMSAADKTKLDGIASGATANTGTVTSVSLATPSEFTVSGSPITSSGTLTISKASQAANLTYASPDGASGVPAFRSLVSNDISNFNSSADARIALQKGAVNGLATLGADSKIPASQLPAIAISDTFVVASQVAMLALVAETGDVAVRTDLNKTFILKGTDPAVLGDWQELLTPTSAVTSVNGQTGAVSLTTTNINEGTNLYYTESRVNANANVAANTAARHTHANKALLDTYTQTESNLADAVAKKHDAVTLGTANGLSLSTQQLSLGLSSASTTGALTTTDWNTFNNKQPAGSYVTSLTGDVTASGPGAAASTITNNVVSNAKLTQVATQTFKGRTTAATGNVEDLTVAQAKTMLNLTGTNSGDQTITLTGAVTGSGTGSFATTVVTNANLTGPVTSVGNATSVTANSITNPMLAQIPTQTFHGRTTAATGNVENLTATQATAMLDVFTPSAKGLAPLSGGGTTNFLRADGTWAAPAGGAGTVTSVASTVPSDLLTVTGSPITSSGTLAYSKVSQAQGLMYASPAGASGVPTFRAIAASDVPTLNQNTTGTAALATTVTTNANLTGPVTSIGNATSIANGAITNAMLANAAVANLSGTNTGDNAPNSLYSGLVSNATHTGDATGSTALTVVRINGTLLSGLATGILKNTTSTGVPSIAVAGDFPTLNQNTTGTAASITGNLTGDVTSTGMATTIATNVVTNAKLAQAPANTLKGNNTGSTANAADLTVAQVKTLLNLTGTNSGDVTLAAVGATPNANAATLTGQGLNLQPFSSTFPGVVTASGGGTTNFLRADGTWAPASGGSSVWTKSGTTLYPTTNGDFVRIGDQSTATQPLQVIGTGGDYAQIKSNGAVETYSSNTPEHYVENQSTAQFSSAKFTLSNSQTGLGVDPRKMLLEKKSAGAATGTSRWLFRRTDNAANFIDHIAIEDDNSINFNFNKGGGAYSYGNVFIKNGNLDLGNASSYIINSPNPVNPQDVATKDYVDTITGGLYTNSWSKFYDFGGVSNTVLGEYVGVVSGTGATWTNVTTNLDGRFGVAQGSTGTTATGRSSFNSGLNSFRLSQGSFRVDYAVNIPVLSNATERFTLSIGIGNSTSAEPTNGAYFSYVDSLSSGNWEIVTANNSTRTRVSSGITAAANTWYKLSVIVNAAGTSVQYLINDVSVGTITTNIPTIVGREVSSTFLILKSLGTTARVVLIDYANSEITFNTPRL